MHETSRYTSWRFLYTIRIFLMDMQRFDLSSWKSALVLIDAPTDVSSRAFDVCSYFLSRKLQGGPPFPIHLVISKRDNDRSAR